MRTRMIIVWMDTYRRERMGDEFQRIWFMPGTTCILLCVVTENGIASREKEVGRLQQLIIQPSIYKFLLTYLT